MVSSVRLEMKEMLGLGISIVVVYIASSEIGIPLASARTSPPPELLAQSPAPYYSPPADLAESPAPDYNPGSGSAESPAPDYSPAPGSDESPAPDYSPASGSAESPTPDYSPASGSAESPAPDSTPLGYYDVTHYGAVADGETESSSAFLSAWKDACSHAGSTFFIPEGTFFLGPVSFSGPCLNNQSPKIDMRGSLEAPTSLDDFPSPEWIVFRNLNGINITGVNGKAILDAQGEESWSKAACRRVMKCHNFPTTLKFINVSHGTISNIGLLNSKAFHVGIHNCDNIDLSGINISAPGDSPNTDGIHVSLSTNISITSSTIGVGDDCVSIGPGSTNISVSFVHCGPGHGISVGSLGKDSNEKDVVGTHVSNCTINGTQNGVRVKTWPGAPPSQASNLVFENIAMINVSNPIIIDQVYCPSSTCKTNEPSQVKLSDINFKNISGTYNTKFAVTLLCSSAVSCENVLLDDINLTYTTPETFRTGRFIAKGGIHGLKILNSQL